MTAPEVHQSFRTVESTPVSSISDARPSGIVPAAARLFCCRWRRGQLNVLPLPSHARLQSILSAKPVSIDTLERSAEQFGASARTVARLLKQETRMSFGQWREQLRLTEAMSRLVNGRPVEQVA